MERGPDRVKHNERCDYIIGLIDKTVEGYDEHKALVKDVLDDLLGDAGVSRSVATEPAKS